MILPLILFHCLIPCLTLAKEASYQKSEEDFSGYSLIQIVPNSNENIELLQYLDTNIDAGGLDFWSPPAIVGKPILLLVHPELNELAKNLFIQRNMTIYLLNITEMMKDEKLQLDIEEERFASSEEAAFAQSLGQYPLNLFTFNTLEEINNYVTHVSKNTANYNPLQGFNVSHRSIGTTHEGRPINMISFSLNDGKEKAAVLLDCGIHAREWISPAFCIYSIDQIVRHPEELLRMYDFYIVPILNPDGYAHTWLSNDDVRCESGRLETGDFCRLWRKNRQPIKTQNWISRTQAKRQFSRKKQFKEAINSFLGTPSHHKIGGGLISAPAQQQVERGAPSSFRRSGLSNVASKFDSRIKYLGTDLNRNFDMDWNTTGSSNNPLEDKYHGPSPFSEQESKALRDVILLINSTQKIASYVSVHSYGQMWLYPYGTAKRVSSHIDDLDRVASKSVSALSSLYGTQYQYGQIWKTLNPNGTYPAGGNSIDWAHAKVGIKYSYTLELRPDIHPGFILDRKFIKATVEETWAGIKAMSREIKPEFVSGMRYSRCSSMDQTNCTSEQECVGYMGTTDLVLKGYCTSLRTKAEACGIVRAPIPNDYHKGYLGNCTAPNTCIKNKCVTGSTQYDFLNIQDMFSL